MGCLLARFVVPAAFVDRMEAEVTAQLAAGTGANADPARQDAAGQGRRLIQASKAGIAHNCLKICEPCRLRLN
jgi:hypothetical protein